MCDDLSGVARTVGSTSDWSRKFCESRGVQRKCREKQYSYFNIYIHIYVYKYILILYVCICVHIMYVYIYIYIYIRIIEELYHIYTKRLLNIKIKVGCLYPFIQSTATLNPQPPKPQHLSTIGRIHCRGVGNATGGLSFIEAVPLTAIACESSAGFSGHLRGWKSTILNGRYIFKSLVFHRHRSFSTGVSIVTWRIIPQR